MCLIMQVLNDRLFYISEYLFEIIYFMIVGVGFVVGFNVDVDVDCG